MQVEVRQSSVLSGPNYLELSGLKSSRRYDIWVKAETSAGYGPSSKVTSVVLSSAGRYSSNSIDINLVVLQMYYHHDIIDYMFYISMSVRPRIVSFGEILAAPWKSDLVLDCLHVGEPTPKVTWSHQQKPVLENSKHQVSKKYLCLDKLISKISK